MGTKGSYTGGGGKAGKDLRKGVSQWADNAASSGGGGPSRPTLSPSALLPAVGLFRATADGTGSSGGSGGGSGGAQRTVAASARSASRAAAAAWALRTGNAETLRELGLDYDKLRNSPDALHVVSEIVQAACGPLADGTIEDQEQRYVAVRIATWILEEQAEGAPPTPEEIVRESIALIIFETACSETAARLKDDDRPAWVGVAAEEEMLATARVLAGNAKLSAGGATERELAQAIEQGIESLRQIWGN